MNVLFHVMFLLGDNDSSSCTDFLNLSNFHYMKIADFCNRIQKSLPLCGKNKRSCDTYDCNQKRLAIQYDIRHYHMVENEKCKIKPCILQLECKRFNLKESYTDSEIIHYVIQEKHENKTLIVFGYSLQHVGANFPSFNKYPLEARIIDLDYSCTYTKFNQFISYCEENGLDKNLSEFNKFNSKT